MLGMQMEMPGMQIEIFGIIKAKIKTPYSNLVRQFCSIQNDIVGFYYTCSSEIFLFLYDSITSFRLSGVKTLAQLLLWESTVEVKTQRIYFDTTNEANLNEVCSLVVSDFYEEKALKRLLNKRIEKSKIWRSIVSSFQNFVFVKSEETLYSKNELSCQCEVLDAHYSLLHEKLFSEMKRLSSEYSLSLRILFSDDDDKEQDFSPSCLLSERIANSISWESFERRRIQNVNFYQNEINLGPEPFSCVLVVNYVPKDSKELSFETKNFKVLLKTQNPDLSFFDKNSLLSLLKFIEFSYSPEHSGLREKIILELNSK